METSLRVDIVNKHKGSIGAERDILALQI